MTKLATVSLAKVLDGSGLTDQALEESLSSGAFELHCALYLNAATAVFGNELSTSRDAADFHTLFSHLWGKYIPDCVNWGKKRVRERICPRPSEVGRNDSMPHLELRYPRHDVLMTIEYDLEQVGEETREVVDVPRLMALALGRYRSEYPRFGAEIKLVCVAERLLKDEQQLDAWVEDFAKKALTGFGAAALADSELLISVCDRVVYKKLKNAKNIKAHNPKNRVRIVLEEVIS